MSRKEGRRRREAKSFGITPDLARQLAPRMDITDPAPVVSPTPTTIPREVYHAAPHPDHIPNDVLNPVLSRLYRFINTLSQTDTVQAHLFARFTKEEEFRKLARDLINPKDEGDFRLKQQGILAGKIFRQLAYLDRLSISESARDDEIVISPRSIKNYFAQLATDRGFSTKLSYPDTIVLKNHQDHLSISEMLRFTIVNLDLDFRQEGRAQQFISGALIDKAFQDPIDLHMLAGIVAKQENLPYVIPAEKPSPDSVNIRIGLLNRRQLPSGLGESAYCTSIDGNRLHDYTAIFSQFATA